MGRKAVGDRPMTAVERQQRRRAKLKALQPGHGTVQEFRIALLRFVETRRLLHGNLTTDEINDSLTELGAALLTDEYVLANPTRTYPDGRVVEFTADWVLTYLNYEHWEANRPDSENWR
jgi:hypothetical protein